jgi:hypothetical protein
VPVSGCNLWRDRHCHLSALELSVVATTLTMENTMAHLSDRQLALYNAAVAIYGQVDLVPGRRTHFESFHEDAGILFFWFSSGDHNHIICEARAKNTWVPVCCGCLKIRSVDGNWYKSLGIPKCQSNATHTICNGCQQRIYPDIHKKIQERNAS